MHISLASITSLLSLTGAASAHFVNSCHSCEVKNYHLTCVCAFMNGAGRGSVGQTSGVNLNNHIGNDNGELRWGSGGFTSSCREYNFDRARMIWHAVCDRRDGSYHRTAIDLKERIWNDNGALVYIQCTT